MGVDDRHTESIILPRLLMQDETMKIPERKCSFYVSHTFNLYILVFVHVKQANRHTT